MKIVSVALLCEHVVTLSMACFYSKQLGAVQYILCVWFILWGGSDRNSFAYNSIVAYKMEHLNKIILIPKHNNSSNIIMITSTSCLKRIKEHVFWFVANNSCTLLPYRNGSFFYSFRYMHKLIYLKRTHAEWIVESFG